MQYTVTSQDRTQNSSLYSVDTGLDSFILFNEETLDEKITLTELKANREEEVSTTKLTKQFSALEDVSKLNKSLELQVIRPSFLNLDTKENDPQMNANPGESKQI